MSPTEKRNGPPPLPEKKEHEERVLIVNTPAFTYGLLATMAVLVILCMAEAMFIFFAQRETQDARSMLFSAQQTQKNCETANTRLQARVDTFEQLLITPQMGAIQAALDEYQTKQGVGPVGTRELTIKDFRAWLKNRH